MTIRNDHSRAAGCPDAISRPFAHKGAVGAVLHGKNATVRLLHETGR